MDLVLVQKASQHLKSLRWAASRITQTVCKRVTREESRIVVDPCDSKCSRTSNDLANWPSTCNEYPMNEKRSTPKSTQHQYVSVCGL